MGDQLFGEYKERAIKGFAVLKFYATRLQDSLENSSTSIDEVIRVADAGERTGNALMDSFAGMLKQIYEFSNAYLSYLDLEQVRSMQEKLKGTLPGTTALLQQATELEDQYDEQLRRQEKGERLEGQLDLGMVTEVTTPRALVSAEESKAMYEEIVFRQAYGQKWASLVENVPFMRKIYKNAS
ncbi:hypothetical protein GF367_00960 [Candidatus Woesearchaeota archaeon]|nr:hypothetical protein [Candidatus Woesearchaeota archaeon]